MARYGILVACAVLLLQSFPVVGQTTAGASATIVVPVIAQTVSYSSEVTVYNPNAATITINPVFYDAQNTASPGPKSCTSLSVGANVTKAFSVASQCALPSGSNFGLLLLTESSGTNRFYGYARTQTSQGIGFSTEGFPIDNFNDQVQHATGLKRVAAAGGLPTYQTNCFVATLGDAVNYELRLFDGSTNVQLGSTLSGSLGAFQQYRYLDVFAAVGLASGNKANVRAQFTNLTGNRKKLIAFCTVQENTSFSADFRIAKSYGGTPQNAFVQGGNTFGTTAVLGTSDNQPLNINVNGERVMRYEPNGNSPNLIAGHPNNGAAFGLVGQTIAGGGEAGTDCADPPSGSNTRSCANETTGAFAAIGGGYANIATDSGTVAGGSSNTAGVASAVGGGSGNTASGRWAVVAGGVANSARDGDAVTLAGGESNVASGDHATVGGGIGNTALGGATVAGGLLNTASAGASTVIGGVGNTASGGQSTVAGGGSNTASGFRSFAAGYRAKATTTGTFMWADSREFDFQPSVSNFFGARATGGVGFTVAIDPATGGVTQFCNLLPGNPSWQCTSDRNAKENFRPVDGMDILTRLSEMPITTWNFKGADPSQRALGPTAQDFYAAFGLGNDDKTIATSNLASVGLAAIQGLHRMMQAKDARIETQQRRIAELEMRVDQIETLRGELEILKRTVQQLTGGDRRAAAE